MCGILFGLTSDPAVLPDHWDSLSLANQKRGPDSQALVSETHHKAGLHWYGAVLHLRGEYNVPQPRVETEGVLCWNGEIFDGIEVPVDTNDTELLSKMLNEAELTDERVLQVFSQVRGPYGFFFFERSTERLWFGRDCLGRRSLLWHLPKHSGDAFVLSSVGPEYECPEGYWEEIPAKGIYCLDLSQGFDFEKLADRLTLHEWHFNEAELMRIPFGRINTSIPQEDDLLSVGEGTEMPTPSELMKEKVQTLIQTLGDSVRRRVVNIPKEGPVTQPRLGILFSGGIDCICLALLADRFLPQDEPIDLLNVAFENPRIQKHASKPNKKKTSEQAPKANYDVPDRKTGRQGVEELRGVAPHRKWNFVEINIPFEEAMAKKDYILSLMAPLNTVMDLSIAMAFWFASRGIGGVVSDLEHPDVLQEYTSPAKVLLLGIGADEQLAGYSRHRENFRHRGWKGLVEEIQFDVDRISTRNLGRDDRIISSHGKEARFPYLDEKLLGFLNSLPIYMKTDMRFERGIGEKLLLRLAAKELGLVNASRFWKRAIQFGARTAKMEDNKEKGNHSLKKEIEP
ncbi:hypothetical protein K493DRAFT_329250 [Basidiobolus meristosporus CBS 931.73]|uniref:Glutamine amidotransferase type-2 domain-containing protein n=1 Tax=Basidiobolus meristosporus CBS 931.73 TaxID=1314790 RepID=A0A1Y1YLP9_9FUNG|nr:hypothetical protein K493DRAFT_329250 [Basidiobolus meristosporus CBS 931.73]|eukprot:ORX98925.1 hypothetical protein K493DRAFT_329250 [Basidiobolus meristosporus CBS 931.73]